MKEARPLRDKLIHDLERALDEEVVDRAAELDPDDIEGFLLAKACEEIHAAACREHDELLDELA